MRGLVKIQTQTLPGGRTVTRLIVTLVAAMLMTTSIAQAMSFNVKPIRLLNGSHHYYVYGTGEILDGDAERFLKALQSSQVSSTDDIFLFLDSPGGSLSEGIKLGGAISDFNVKTYVGRQTSDDPLKPLPGQCSSACVFAYLGGSYRYLDDGSDLGVHQFAISDNNIQAGTAIAISQIAAAQVIEFIKKSRADTKLFTLMTSALPSEIYFVPHDVLRELRVVTDGTWDEDWSFEYNEFPYLRIRQQSINGENRLIVGCTNNELIGEIFAEGEPKLVPHAAGIFINGILIIIPDRLMLTPPKMGPKFATAVFVITPELAYQMLTANSIGAAIQPLNKDLFFGFQINTAKGKDKLERIISGCHH
jgi:hypothetical protein